MIYKIEIGFFDYLRTLFFSLSSWIPWFFIPDLKGKIILVCLPIIITLYFVLKLESIEFYEKSIIIRKSFLMFNSTVAKFDIDELKKVKIYYSKSLADYGYIISFNFWKLKKEDITVRLYSRQIDLHFLDTFFSSGRINFEKE